jgi:hypothetical protein
MLSLVLRVGCAEPKYRLSQKHIQYIWQSQLPQGALAGQAKQDMISFWTGKTRKSACGGPVELRNQLFLR